MLTAPPGLNAMRHMEQCLQAVAKTKMTSEQKLTLLAMDDDFVFGHALREAADETTADLEFVEAQMATGAFPQLAEVFKNGTPTQIDRFQIGLHVLLEGKRSWAR